MPGEAKVTAGPTIHAVHAWGARRPEKSARHQLLSERDRIRLAKIATIVRFKKGEQIYLENDDADLVFSLVEGVVTAYRIVKDTEHVFSFLRSGDLFGLSEESRYANSTRATTSVVDYKIPLSAVRLMFDNRANLDVNVIVKLCEELREAQRHAVLLVQRRAVTRLAMFLDLQEHLQAARRETISEIYLPMDRSSIAAYLGLTLAALSRAFRALVAKKIIFCRNRQHVSVLDRDALSKVADMHTSVTKLTRPLF
jgi:CRP/FNR family transcriptional regulator